MRGETLLSALLLAALASAVAGLILLARARARRERRDTLAREALAVASNRLAQSAMQDERQEERQEERQRVLAEVLAGAGGADAPPGSRAAWAAIAAAAALAIAALFVQWTNDGARRAAARTDTASAEPAPRTLSEEQLTRTIAQAKQAVEADPNNADQWAMIAHSYDMLGRFKESSEAYKKLAQLMPRDAQVLADYADALAVANGRSLAGQPTALVLEALAIDARNVKALALAGTAAFEREAFGEAVGYWQRAHDASSDPAVQRQIAQSIEEARAAGRRAEAPAGAAPKAAGGGGSVPASVSGRVSVAPALARDVSPDATVFIFARPVTSASRMPVAVIRKRVRDLPLAFELDDSAAMVPGAGISTVASVVVEARVSQRGDVMAQAGDLHGETLPVRVGSAGVELVINEVTK